MHWYCKKAYETKVWRDKKRSKIRGVQTDNLTGFLCIRTIGTLPNPLAKDWVDERIDACVL